MGTYRVYAVRMRNDDLMDTENTHVAYPGPAIIALFPTRGGWRGRCDCGWLEGKAHRSEREADKACRRHVRESVRAAS